jgi:flagellar hook-associated protein 1 FlgK
MNCDDDPTQGESAYDVTKGFAVINSDPSLFKEGKLQDYLNAINSQLGIDSSQASRFNASYKDAITVIDNQRINISGVDITEEMVNMVKCQQLYQASARLVSTINTIYETLINRLGA